MASRQNDTSVYMVLANIAHTPWLGVLCFSSCAWDIMLYWALDTVQEILKPRSVDLL